MSNRFGTDCVFNYTLGNDFSTGTTIVTLLAQSGQMPQHPFETDSLTDRTSYRSKSGRKYVYQNYILNSYTFNWTLLDEASKNSLKTMYYSAPLISLNSAGTNWGTFRFSDDSWKDSESVFGLFDLSFTLEEDSTLPSP